MKKILIIIASVCAVALVIVFGINHQSVNTQNETLSPNTETTKPVGETKEKLESNETDDSEETQSNDTEVDETAILNTSQIVEETVNDDGSRDIVVMSADGTQTTITITSTDVTQQSIKTGQEQVTTEKKNTATEKDATASTDSNMLSYEDYCAMSSKEQREFYETFESDDAFFDWYNAAKEAYEKAHPAIEIKEGDIIDLGGGN